MLVALVSVTRSPGGVKETEWLRELSELTGDYDHETVSYSMNKGVWSTNVQNNRRRILDTSELAKLPRGRAIVLAPHPHRWGSKRRPSDR